jgi:hypothetical protein
MEIHLKMFQWIVAFGAEWRKELPCNILSSSCFSMLVYRILERKLAQQEWQLSTVKNRFEPQLYRLDGAARDSLCVCQLKFSVGIYFRSVYLFTLTAIFGFRSLLLKLTTVLVLWQSRR